MPKIWFSSDSHYYHTNILKYCPNRTYSTVEEMNEDLVNRWNSVVSPDDTVYFLGDFSLAFRPVELFTKRLNGHKHLIAGNHDFVHNSHKKSRTLENKTIWFKKYLDNGWESVQQCLELDIGDKIINLCHLPYLEAAETGQDQRHASHRLPDDGRVLLCGHVHQRWKARKTSKGTLMINVGVDVNDMTPVSLEHIKEFIKENS